ncbi:Uncharacterized protein FWK35_00028990, partial [Aphis craccivora]
YTRPGETAATAYCFWRPPSSDGVKANAPQQSCTRDTPTMTACERKCDCRRTRSIYSLRIYANGSYHVREDLAQNNNNNRTS